MKFDIKKLIRFVVNNMGDIKNVAAALKAIYDKYADFETRMSMGSTNDPIPDGADPGEAEALFDEHPVLQQMAFESINCEGGLHAVTEMQGVGSAFGLITIVVKNWSTIKMILDTMKN